MSCSTEDINDHFHNTTELTKNGLDTVKVPDEVQGSKTADNAVELVKEIENESEIGLHIKKISCRRLANRNDQTKLIRSGS